MKTLCILALLLFACAKATIPDRDIIIITPCGPVLVEKGFLDDTNNYYTIPEWNEFMQEQKKQMQGQDKKKFF